MRKRPQCIPYILWINKRIHLLAYLRQKYLCFTIASTRTLIMEPVCHPECLAEDDSGASQRCRISHITERENWRFSPSTSVRNIWWSEFTYTNSTLHLTAGEVTSKHNTHKQDRLEMRVDRRVLNSATYCKHCCNGKRHMRSNKIPYSKYNSIPSAKETTHDNRTNVNTIQIMFQTQFVTACHKQVCHNITKIYFFHVNEFVQTGNIRNKKHLNMYTSLFYRQYVKLVVGCLNKQ